MKDIIRLKLTHCWSLIMLWKIYINCINIELSYWLLLFPFVSSVVLFTSPLDIVNQFLSQKFCLFKKKLNYNFLFSLFTLHLVSLRFSPQLFFFGLKKHFLKDLNRISPYECNTICLYIHFLKNILHAYTFQ